MHAAPLVLFPSPLIHEIVAAAEPLEGTIDAIEPGFAALGIEVQHLHKSARELARACPCLTAPPAGATARPEAPGLLATELEALVSLLQAGDALRQRGEHIVVALHEISAWLASADTRLDFALRATEVDCLLALQIKQLAAVRADADATHQRLHTLFSSIEASADAFAARPRALQTPVFATPALVRRGTFLCTQLRSIAARASSRLEFLREIDHGLTRQLDALAVIRRHLAPHVDTSLDTTAVTERFAQHYTTDAERAIDAGASPTSAPTVPGIEIFES